MSRSFLVELVCLYWPILVSLVLGAIVFDRDKRACVAMLFGGLWQMAVLPWLGGLGVYCGWWSFEQGVMGGWHLCGLPLSFWIGWSFWWGPLALVVYALFYRFAGKWSLLITLILFGLMDVWLMPWLEPVLLLNDGWLVGEALLLVVGCLPGMVLMITTWRDERVAWRSFLLMVAWGLLVLGVIPLASFGGDFNMMTAAIIEREAIWNILLFLLAGLAALPALLGVYEFARVGRGTPVPLDPPRKLVETGVYSRCRNPMQTGMTGLLCVWSALLGSWWPFVIAVIGVVYSYGLAQWSEEGDLKRRFGKKYTRYKKRVKKWIFCRY